jgi:hypothetical protein
MDCTINKSKLTREQVTNARSKVGHQQEISNCLEGQDLHEEANDSKMVLG